MIDADSKGRVSFKKVFKNNKGSSILQILLAAGLMTITAAATVSTMTEHNKNRSAFLFKSQVNEIKLSLISAIASDTAWQKTITTNTDMRCSQRSQRFCTPQATERKTFALYDSDGKVIFDSTSPTAGYRFDGTTCDTYSADGNDLCPLRVVLRWRAACSDALCNNKEEFISINFEYSPLSKENKFPFNTANYNQVETSRQTLQRSASPVLECSNLGLVFIGRNQTYNGHSSDEKGCIGYIAFRGPQGLQGPAGPTGPMGPAGPAGPAGADAVCP